MHMLSKDYIREKWNHAGFQKYFQNMGWMFFGKFFGLGISFFVTAYVVRQLGPENYGQLSYAVSYISIYYFIATLGIDQILYRDIIKFPNEKNSYMGTALILKLLFGLMASIICVISALFFSIDDVSLFLIIILSLTFIFNSFSIITYEFQANVESKYPSIISLIILFILNTLKVLSIVYGKGVIYLALILTLEAILTCLLLIFIRTRRYGSIRQWRFNTIIAKSLISDSWPLIFSSAFALVYARIDQIMIKHMVNTESVGIYDAAVRISELWYLIPNIIVISLFPAIVNAKSISNKEYARRLRNLGFLLIIIAIAIAIPTTFFARYILYIIYGTTFIAGFGVLQIYIWSNIGIFLSNLSSNYLINENMRFVTIVSTGIGMISNIILNIILIPHYGINGSAIATLISYSLVPISIFIFKKPRKDIFNIQK